MMMNRNDHTLEGVLERYGMALAKTFVAEMGAMAAQLAADGCAPEEIRRTLGVHREHFEKVVQEEIWVLANKLNAILPRRESPPPGTFH